MGRERWVVRNTTQKQINIGDLFNAPTVAPGSRANLLDYHTHSQITQSEDLAALLEMGWLRLIKTNVPSQVQLNRIEQDELDTSIAEAVPQKITVTASFIMSGNELDVVFADASAGDLIITLPLAETDRQIYVKKIDSTSNTVTITGQNSQTIDDVLTWEISAQYVTMLVNSDGLNWHIL